MILPNPSSGERPHRKRAWAESLLLAGAGLALALALFFPLWSITLEAPQYPEGLGMHIWAHSVEGISQHDLANINELNHYIGMKKIIPASIPELRFIPPIILIFAAASLLAAIRPRAWMIALLLACLAGSGAYGMYDFWRWEFDYGHNLDPMAAIKVPGTSFQPPLIGEAHILNFESESWPAAGSYLLFAAGGMIAASLAFSLARRYGLRPLARLTRAASITSVLCLALAGCGSGGPVPFQWGEDACHFCKMTLVEKGFAAQRINAKGKAYKYDSIECLLGDLEAHPLQPGERLYVSDRSRPDAALADAATVHYLQGGGLSSPMGKALAAFAARDSAAAWQARMGGEVLPWDRLRVR
jgi:copper chaperone NosL